MNEKALIWWEKMSFRQKLRIVKSWHITKDMDFRKKWDVEQITKSPETITELYHIFVS